MPLKRHIAGNSSDIMKHSIILLMVFMTIASSAIHCRKSKPEKIIFFGDSITELGVKPNGYVTLVRNDLAKQFPRRKITVIGAGVSGNKVSDLEKRLADDVLSKNPDIVIIYIGINDVWHWILPGHVGTTPEDFEAGLHGIIAELKAANADIILCTPSVVGEKKAGENPLDSKLDQYAQISRNIAEKESISLIDLRKEFRKYLSENNPENVDKGILTYDGVHLNNRGNRFIADIIRTELLKMLY